MNTIQAIILDVAGTCLDFGSCAPVGIFRAIFKKHGVPVSPDEVRVPMGSDKREHIRRMLQEQPQIAKRWVNSHDGQVATDKDIDQMYQEMEEMALTVLPEYAVPIDGVIDVLLHMKNKYGVKLALTSGYNRQMLDVTLDAAEKNYGFMSKLGITVTVSSSDVSKGRPAPYMIFRAMELLDVTDVDKCIVVGDTVADILAANSANTISVGVTGTGNGIGLSKEEFDGLSKQEQGEMVEAARSVLYDYDRGPILAIKTLGELEAGFQEYYGWRTRQPVVR